MISVLMYKTPVYRNTRDNVFHLKRSIIVKIKKMHPYVVLLSQKTRITPVASAPPALWIKSYTLCLLSSDEWATLYTMLAEAPFVPSMSADSDSARSVTVKTGRDSDASSNQSSVIAEKS